MEESCEIWNQRSVSLTTGGQLVRLLAGLSESSVAYAFVEQVQNWGDTSIQTRTSGNGPPVVLLHSLAGHSDHWRSVQPYLSENGYRVTAIDLPGHGASGMPNGALTPRWIGQSLAQSLTAPTLLVGNSLGGWVALEAYLARPSQVLGICLVASAGLEGMPIVPAKLQLQPGRGDLIEILLETVFHKPSALSPEVRQVFLANMLTPALLRLSGATAIPTRTLRQIRCPVLILWGLEDRILPVEWADVFAAALPSYKKVVLPSCGHLPQLECPDAFNRELLAFAELFRFKIEAS